MVRKKTVGEVFGRLVVIEDLYPQVSSNKKVVVRCMCGNIKTVCYGNLKSGDTQSCGCYNIEKVLERQTKHGKTKTKLYYVWYNMRGRCYRKTDREYHNYGARGIKVCEEWRNDFSRFNDWAIQNGYTETDDRGCQIDRKENDKDYSADNCRFVSAKRSSLNRRVSVIIEFNGEKKPLSDWCDIYGLKYKRAYQQIKRDGKILSDLIKANK